MPTLEAQTSFPYQQGFLRYAHEWAGSFTDRPSARALNHDDETDKSFKARRDGPCGLGEIGSTIFTAILRSFAVLLCFVSIMYFVVCASAMSANRCQYHDCDS